MNRTTNLIGAAVFSLLVLAGCAEPESAHMDAHDYLQREQVVIDNMRRVQVAAEHYAAEHGGSTYPTQIDEQFKTYLPGGVAGQIPAPVGPANPFTGINEFPSIGSVKDPSAARAGERFNVPVGQIQYTPLGGGKGYAIVGGAHDGKALADPNNPGQILVYSNQ